jgi:hypothetical protein
MPASVVKTAAQLVVDVNSGTSDASRTATFPAAGVTSAGNSLVVTLGSLSALAAGMTVTAQPSGTALTFGREGEFGPSVWYLLNAPAGTTGVKISHAGTGYAAMHVLEVSGVSTVLTPVTARTLGGIGGADFSFTMNSSAVAGMLVIAAMATALSQYSSGDPDDSTVTPDNGETSIGELRPPSGDETVFLQTQYLVLPVGIGDLVGWTFGGTPIPYTNPVYIRLMPADAGLSVSVNDAVYVDDEDEPTAVLAGDAISAFEAVTVVEGLQFSYEQVCTMRFVEPISGYTAIFPCDSYQWGFLTARDQLVRDFGITGHGVVHRQLIVGPAESDVRAIRRMRIRFEGIDVNLMQLRRLAWFAQLYASRVKFYPDYYGAGNPGNLYWWIDWQQVTETERIIENRLSIELDIIEQATDTSGSGGISDPIYLP